MLERLVLDPGSTEVKCDLFERGKCREIRHQINVSRPGVPERISKHWPSPRIPPSFYPPSGASLGTQFPPGQTVVTRTALAMLSALNIAGALYRHQRGDWGDVGNEGGQANERALKQGERLL